MQLSRPSSSLDSLRHAEWFARDPQAPPASTQSSAPPRVVVVSRGGTALPEPLGGADVYALRQSIVLAESGAAVTLIAPGTLPSWGTPSTLTLHAVPTTRSYRTQQRLLYYVKALSLAIWTALYAAAYLRRTQADVVHCHHSVSVILLRLLAKRTTLVYTVHDQPYSPLDKGQPFIHGAIRIFNNLVLEKLASRFSNGIFAISSPIKKVVRAWGVPEIRCSLTPIITLDSPLPIEDEGKHNRSIAPTRTFPYAITVGALTGRKRVDLLIRALALTKPDRRLIIVGAGPLKKNLVQLSVALRVADRITWLDSVFGSEWSDLLRGALFCVLVSEREGYPTILLEALHEGTPVLYVSSRPLEGGIEGPFFSYLRSLDLIDIARCFDERWEHWARNCDSRKEIQEWAKASLPSSGSIARGMMDFYARLIKIDAENSGTQPG